jgi:predicted dehydrogenase
VRDIGVGLIGCGNISGIYLTNLPRAPGVKVRACADMKVEVAEAQAKKFGVEAATVDALLARDDIDVVVNLTIPAAHAAVSLAALSAGKHVFCEKPLATDAELGRKLVAEAEARGLLLGCAPDTFLGAGHRTARRLIDDGAIGRVLWGAAFVVSHGMENWHPDPEFFFKPGGGPVLDVGPYYITALVNLLGPVARVQSVTGTGFPERLVTSQGPRKGHRITVETPTTALSLLEFVSGAQVIFGASWDVWRHSLPPIELYGADGSMRLPDPNFFGGVVETTKQGGEWTAHATDKLPLGAVNWPPEAPRVANHRALGVAEMAAALRGGAPPRATGRLALHALEVMEAIVTGGTKRGFTAIANGAERPPALSEDEAAKLFAT